jgi:hypothetical protein
MYDSNIGFTTDFSKNGDVDNWEEYYNIFMYGAWSGVLFGSSYDHSCYINKSENFLPVVADEYYYIEIMMQIVDENPNLKSTTLTTGKIQWKRLEDNFWSDEREIEFELKNIGSWYLYKINVGPHKYWIGDICNLRVYPFINGRERDKFFIKFIRITSDSVWSCHNTDCSAYLQFEHPCPWIGAPATIEAETKHNRYTTYSGINSILELNIDDYGFEKIDIGTNINLSKSEIAKVLGNNISLLNIGGYTYADVFISEQETISIQSGTNSTNSSIELKYTKCAEDLGFFNNLKEPTYKYIQGEEPATGFDYGATRLLPAYELNAILDNNLAKAYTHNTKGYTVEAGRRDFNEIGTSKLLSEMRDEVGKTLQGSGKITLDIAHRVDNNGKLIHFWAYGVAHDDSCFVIYTPHNDGSYTLKHKIPFIAKDDYYLYSKIPVVSYVEHLVTVTKGDVIGVYNFDLYVGHSNTGMPNATFAQFSDFSEDKRIFPESNYSYGVGGFAIYTRGDLKQTNSIIDIDLGQRTNVSELILYGFETEDKFEYNVAACLDLTWSVDLFNGTHIHWGCYGVDCLYSFTHTHTNKYYGKECLDDLITTANNGRIGDTYSNDSDGLNTYGDHSYFYVNGDAEWLFSKDCNGRSEYCPHVYPAGTRDFKYDPIAFTLYFPLELDYDIFKTVMYFKEEDNFRQFYLASYHGNYYVAGNTNDVRFKYVPKYDQVGVDGALYNYGDNRDIDTYLFKNPCLGTVTNLDDEEQKDSVLASQFVDWTKLTHVFDPIKCKGFRIYCNYHNSTKITELEAYSYVNNTTTLVDNAVIQYSEYGDHWTTVGFYDAGEAKAVAYIGATPRYIRLYLESHLNFDIQEVSISVTKQDNVDSNSLILLDEAKNGILNSSITHKIYNTFTRSFDLTVDIPKDLALTNNIIYWNTLSNDASLAQSNVGPKALLYKNNDFEITTYKGQCAINTFTYGLKNLVFNKDVYYVSNGYDINYIQTFDDTPYMDICNKEYINTFNLEITFNAVSSKFWRVTALTTDRVIRIKDIICLYDDKRVDIKNLITQYKDIEGHYKTAHNGVTIPLIVNFDSGFSNGDSSKWFLNNVDTVEGDSDYVKLFIGATSDVLVSSIPFLNTEDFEFQSSYVFESNYTSEDEVNVFMDVNFEFYSNTTRLFYIKLYNPGTANLGALNCNDGGYPYIVSIFVNDIEVFSDNFNGEFLCFSKRHYFIIRKSLNKVSLFIDAFYIATFTVDNNSIIDNFIIAINGSSTSYGINNITLYEADFYKAFLLVSTGYIGVELTENNPVDKISLIVSDDTLVADISTSYDEVHYFSLSENIDTTIYPNKISVIIDLEKRHSLSLIRNYGDNENLFDISTNLNTSFSNTEDIDLESFTSTIDDCRYLMVHIPSDDSTLRCIYKLGVYSNTSNILCTGGGYNNEWVMLNNVLSEYPPITNVALNKPVEANTYVEGNHPENIVTGNIENLYGDNTWAYEKGQIPEVIIDLEDTYNIIAFKLYNGYSEKVGEPLNQSITFSLSPTVSGLDFVEVFSTYSIIDNIPVLYEITSTKARRAKLTINSFTTLNYLSYIDGAYVELNIGMLKQIEIFAQEGIGEVSSEDYPIVCMNLRDSFDIVDHSLHNRYKQPEDSTVNDIDNNEWDNNDLFFKYADSLFEDPEKIKFQNDKTYVSIYETLEEVENLEGLQEYTFDSVVFLPRGNHYVTWKAYYPEQVEEICLVLESEESLYIYATVYGTGWVEQQSNFFLENDGYYTIKVQNHLDYTKTWGAGSIKVVRRYGLTRWVSFMRDTATNYSYDFNADKNGPDFINTAKFFGSSRYNIAEYYWWWQTYFSELSNDSIYVLDGKKSLKLIYPDTTFTEVLSFIPGDTFGTDGYWSIYDALSFNLYIDNVDNMDLTFGYITLGSIMLLPGDFYYQWDISAIKLDTGWNEVNLVFNDADKLYPENLSSAYLHEALNIKKSDTELSSFSVTFRGVGNSFILYFDKFKIKRNKFLTKVRHSNGLCLTSQDTLMIPLSNVYLSKGALECWVRFGVNTNGLDAFGDLYSSTLFTLNNNNNDIVALRIKPADWFEIIVGSIRKQLLYSKGPVSIPNININRDEIAHVALVWSNDATGMDNADTVRLYINGSLIMFGQDTWDLDETKLSYLKLGGGISQSSQVFSSYGNFIYDNIKIYNYCKTDFKINQQNIEGERLYQPENFIEISKDNTNFYGPGSIELPFIFEQVNPGDYRTLYIRTNKLKNLKQSSTTAQVLINWLTSV